MGTIFISAARKSSGKTIVSLGLCAALRSEGVAVQPFKKGPDYIDPIWLTKACERDCFNLDFNTMSQEQLTQCFAQRSHGSQFQLIEGNKGLFDGMSLDGSDCNAALCEVLNVPVLLVMDVQGITRGIAPILLGYQAFDSNVTIAGVILNKVAGARHEQKLRNAVAHYTDMPIVGAIPRDPALHLTERHLGLVPGNEFESAGQLIQSAGDMIAEHVDLNLLQELGGVPNQLTQGDPGATTTPTSDVRIGIARDSVFSFYYADDLNALRLSGAELVFFDSVADTRLPDVDGLFIGGGFPETQLEALESNMSLRRDIKHFVDAGGPVYAECGGLMYLSRSISWRYDPVDMVDVLPLDIVMQDRPVGRGYVVLAETGLLPWRKVADGKDTFPAHEFHYSKAVNMDSNLQFAFKVNRGVGVNGEYDGLIHKNVVASFSHLRSVFPNQWAQSFTEFVREKS